jgi:hypothetical protein
MAKQGAPIDVVVMESSGHYWFNLASHLRRLAALGTRDQPRISEPLVGAELID